MRKKTWLRLHRLVTGPNVPMGEWIRIQIATPAELPAFCIFTPYSRN